MRVLITGAAGLVGKAVLENLKGKWDPLSESPIVIATDIHENKELGINKLDITTDDVYNIGVLEPDDIIIHLAALVGGRPSEKNPEAYFKVNVMGTINLLEAMRENGLKNLVFLSSWSIYGNDIELPITEATLQDPQNPYALSKVMCEEVIRLYGKLYGINSIILRPPFIYGPEQTEKILVQEIVDCIIEKKPFEIWGKGTHTREYIYMDDMTEVIVQAALKRMEGQNMYVVGTNQPISVKEICERVNQYVAPLDVKWVPSNKWVFSQRSEPDKMVLELGVNPYEFIDVIEGIRRCLEWKLTGVGRIGYLDQLDKKSLNSS